MRSNLLLAAVLSGCIHGAPPSSVTGAALGRVVIYRNGVAFYERRAHTQNGTLTLHVPRGAVDDFLKSLTVTDPTTKEPLSISIPRVPQAGDSLSLQVTTPDKRDADVMLTYVAASPEWKPSYRAAVGSDGNVMFESWAIVDNTSTEDWNRVLVGVGASSAMSFRYDLWSVREVGRKRLVGDAHFAPAPPSGVSPYSGATSLESTYIVDGANPKAAPAGNAPTGTAAGAGGTASGDANTGSITGFVRDKQTGAAAIGATVVAAGPTLAGEQVVLTDDHGGFEIRDLPAGTYSVTTYYNDVTTTDTGIHVGAHQRTEVSEQIDQSQGHPRGEAITIMGTAPAIDPSSTSQGITITQNYLKNIPTGRTFDDVVGAAAGARTDDVIVEDEPIEDSDAPIGETHFVTARPMDVKAGTSAMVSMVHSATPGGVVYLYDPISARGNARFAFRALELTNPTDDTLEPGPMTVYGDQRFIGEGLTDAVPPHGAMVVPFASDRQIKIETTDGEDEHIAKLLTVERGVLTAEMQQRKTTHFHVESRLDEPAKVFLRYQLETGWALLDAPSKRLELGSSTLFEVDVPAKSTVDVAISEAAPKQRTIDLSTDAVRELMSVDVDDPDAALQLTPELEAVIATHRAESELADKLATLREQLAEYKARDSELHVQVVSLQAVHTGGSLLTGLRTKLLDTSTKVQELTIAIANTEEQQLALRSKLADQLAALHLPDTTAAASAH